MVRNKALYKLFFLGGFRVWVWFGREKRKQQISITFAFCFAKQTFHPIYRNVSPTFFSQLINLERLGQVLLYLYLYTFFFFFF